MSLTLSKIINRVKEIGIPIEHNEFINSVNDPVPDPPFMVYIYNKTVRGSDNKNMIQDLDTSLELYTDRIPNTKLEEEIETKVLHDIEFKKYQALIQDENMVQTAYEFKITEKLRKEHSNG